MTKPYNWKIFWILIVAATIGLIAIVPYSLALSASAIPAKLPMPLPVLAATLFLTVYSWWLYREEQAVR